MSKPEFVEFSKRIEFECQWPALLMPRRYNWIDFDIVKLFAEYEKPTAMITIEIALLGFKMKLLLPGPSTAKSRELMARKAAVMAGELEMVEVAEGIMMPKEVLEAMAEARQMGLEKRGNKTE